MEGKHLFRLKAIFYTLIGIFILLVVYITIPVPGTIKRAIFPFGAVLAVIFFLLGMTLIYFTIKLKVKGKLRLFLILTGASSSGFLISVILHNLIYGLFIYLFGSGFWDRIGLSDEPLFFILAIIVCPILFLAGVIGSIVVLKGEGMCNPPYQSYR